MTVAGCPDDRPQASVCMLRLHGQPLNYLLKFESWKKRHREPVSVPCWSTALATSNTSSSLPGITSSTQTIEDEEHVLIFSLITFSSCYRRLNLHPFCRRTHCRVFETMSHIPCLPLCFFLMMVISGKFLLHRLPGSDRVLVSRRSATRNLGLSAAVLTLNDLRFEFRSVPLLVLFRRTLPAWPSPL